eukprot:220951-Amphidinium_carterae.1
MPFRTSLCVEALKAQVADLEQDNAGLRSQVHVALSNCADPALLCAQNDARFRGSLLDAKIQPRYLLKARRRCGYESVGLNISTHFDTGSLEMPKCGLVRSTATRMDATCLTAAGGATATVRYRRTTESLARATHRPGAHERCTS